MAENKDKRQAIENQQNLQLYMNMNKFSALSPYFTAS